MWGGVGRGLRCGVVTRARGRQSLKECGARVPPSGSLTSAHPGTRLGRFKHAPKKEGRSRVSVSVLYLFCSSARHLYPEDKNTRMTRSKVI